MLDGAKLICLNEKGDSAQVIEAKGRNFTIGYLMDCDLILHDDNRAEKIHCQIECDAFGHVTIQNKSNTNPIQVNGEIVANKRTLFNNSNIIILDKKYLWQQQKITSNIETEEISTPVKQIGIPEQPPSSCPSLKNRRELLPRFTMHNFHAYRITSHDDIQTYEEGYDEDEDEDGDADIDDDKDNIDQVESATIESDINPTVPLTGIDTTPAKVELVHITPDKETLSTEKKMKLFRNVCGWSGMTTTSYSPRETGVRLETSFTAIIPPPNKRSSICRTPKGVLEKLHQHANGLVDKQDNNEALISFATPMKKAEGEESIIVRHAKSAMLVVDLTTPLKLRPRLYTPKSATASIKRLPLHKTNLNATVAELGLAPLPATPKSSIMTGDTSASNYSAISVDSSDCTGLSAAEVGTPLRTPQQSAALRKQALLMSAKKQHVAKTPTARTSSTPSTLIPVRNTASKAAIQTPLSSKIKSTTAVDSPKSNATVTPKVAASNTKYTIHSVHSTSKLETPLLSAKKQGPSSSAASSTLLTTSTPYKSAAVVGKPDLPLADNFVEVISLLHSSNEEDTVPPNKPIDSTRLVDDSQLPAVSNEADEENAAENDELLKQIEDILHTSDELKKQLQDSVHEEQVVEDKQVNSDNNDDIIEITAPTTPPSPQHNNQLQQPQTPKSSFSAAILLKTIDEVDKLKAKAMAQKEDDEKENKINECAETSIRPAMTPSVAIIQGAATQETTTPLTPKRITKRRLSISSERNDVAVVPPTNSTQNNIDHNNTENMGAIVEEEECELEIAPETLAKNPLMTPTVKKQLVMECVAPNTVITLNNLEPKAVSKIIEHNVENETTAATTVDIKDNVKDNINNAGLSSLEVAENAAQLTKEAAISMLNCLDESFAEPLSNDDVENKATSSGREIQLSETSTTAALSEAKAAEIQAPKEVELSANEQQQTVVVVLNDSVDGTAANDTFEVEQQPSADEKAQTTLNETFEISIAKKEKTQLNETFELETTNVGVDATNTTVEVVLPMLNKTTFAESTSTELNENIDSGLNLQTVLDENFAEIAETTEQAEQQQAYVSEAGANREVGTVATHGANKSLPLNTTEGTIETTAVIDVIEEKQRANEVVVEPQSNTEAESHDDDKWENIVMESLQLTVEDDSYIDKSTSSSSPIEQVQLSTDKSQASTTENTNIADNSMEAKQLEPLELHAIVETTELVEIEEIHNKEIEQVTPRLKHAVSNEQCASEMNKIKDVIQDAAIEKKDEEKTETISEMPSSLAESIVDVKLEAEQLDSIEIVEKVAFDETAVDVKPELEAEKSYSNEVVEKIAFNESVVDIKPQLEVEKVILSNAAELAPLDNSSLDVKPLIKQDQIDSNAMAEGETSLNESVATTNDKTYKEASDSNIKDDSTIAPTIMEDNDSKIQALESQETLQKSNEVKESEADTTANNEESEHFNGSKVTEMQATSVLESTIDLTMPMEVGLHGEELNIEQKHKTNMQPTVASVEIVSQAQTVANKPVTFESSISKVNEISEQPAAIVDEILIENENEKVSEIQPQLADKEKAQLYPKDGEILEEKEKSNSVQPVDPIETNMSPTETTRPLENKVSDLEAEQLSTNEPLKTLETTMESNNELQSLTPEANLELQGLSKDKDLSKEDELNMPVEEMETDANIAVLETTTPMPNKESDDFESQVDKTSNKKEQKTAVEQESTLVAQNIEKNNEMQLQNLNDNNTCAETAETSTMAAESSFKKTNLEEDTINLSDDITLNSNDTLSVDPADFVDENETEAEQGDLEETVGQQEPLLVQVENAVDGTVTTNSNEQTDDAMQRKTVETADFETAEAKSPQTAAESTFETKPIPSSSPEVTIDVELAADDQTELKATTEESIVDAKIILKDAQTVSNECNQTISLDDSTVSEQTENEAKQVGSNEFAKDVLLFKTTTEIEPQDEDDQSAQNESSKKTLSDDSTIGLEAQVEVNQQDSNKTAATVTLFETTTEVESQDERVQPKSNETVEKATLDDSDISVEPQVETVHSDSTKTAQDESLFETTIGVESQAEGDQSKLNEIDKTSNLNDSTIGVQVPVEAKLKDANETVEEVLLFEETIDIEPQSKKDQSKLNETRKTTLPDDSTTNAHAQLTVELKDSNQTAEQVLPIDITTHSEPQLEDDQPKSYETNQKASLGESTVELVQRKDDSTEQLNSTCFEKVQEKETAVSQCTVVKQLEVLEDVDAQTSDEKLSTAKIVIESQVTTKTDELEEENLELRDELSNEAVDSRKTPAELLAAPTSAHKTDETQLEKLESFNEIIKDKQTPPLDEEKQQDLAEIEENMFEQSTAKTEERLEVEIVKEKVQRMEAPSSNTDLQNLDEAADVSGALQTPSIIGLEAEQNDDVDIPDILTSSTKPNKSPSIPEELPAEIKDKQPLEVANFAEEAPTSPEKHEHEIESDKKSAEISTPLMTIDATTEKSLQTIEIPTTKTVETTANEILTNDVKVKEPVKIELPSDQPPSSEETTSQRRLPRRVAVAPKYEVSSDSDDGGHTATGRKRRAPKTQTPSGKSKTVARVKSTPKTTETTENVAESTTKPASPTPVKRARGRKLNQTGTEIENKTVDAIAPLEEKVEPLPKKRGRRNAKQAANIATEQEFNGIAGETQQTETVLTETGEESHEEILPKKTTARRRGGGAATAGKASKQAAQEIPANLNEQTMENTVVELTSNTLTVTDAVVEAKPTRKRGAVTKRTTKAKIAKEEDSLAKIPVETDETEVNSTVVETPASTKKRAPRKPRSTKQTQAQPIELVAEPVIDVVEAVNTEEPQESLPAAKPIRKGRGKKAVAPLQLETATTVDATEIVEEPHAKKPAIKRRGAASKKDEILEVTEEDGAVSPHKKRRANTKKEEANEAAMPLSVDVGAVKTPPLENVDSATIATTTKSSGTRRVKRIKTVEIATEIMAPIDGGGGGVSGRRKPATKSAKQQEEHVEVSAETEISDLAQDATATNKRPRARRGKETEINVAPVAAIAVVGRRTKRKASQLDLEVESNASEATHDDNEHEQYTQQPLTVATDNNDIVVAKKSRGRRAKPILPAASDTPQELDEEAIIATSTSSASRRKQTKTAKAAADTQHNKSDSVNVAVESVENNDIPATLEATPATKARGRRQKLIESVEPKAPIKSGRGQRRKQVRFNELATSDDIGAEAATVESTMQNEKVVDDDNIRHEAVEVPPITTEVEETVTSSKRRRRRK